MFDTVESTLVINCYKRPISFNRVMAKISQNDRRFEYFTIDYLYILVIWFIWWLNTDIDVVEKLTTLLRGLVNFYTADDTKNIHFIA